MTTVHTGPRAAEGSSGYLLGLGTSRPDVLLARASSRVNRDVEAELARRGLTVNQHLVLQMLSDLGRACIQRELCQELGIDRSVMVNCVDALEATGLVRRERCPRDRRAFGVLLTDGGYGALVELDDALREAVGRAFRGLTPRERSTLTDVLTKVVRAG